MSRDASFPPSASVPDSTPLADCSQACYTSSVLGCKDVYSELQIRTAHPEISGTGIYALRNMVTGKVYIGSAVNLPKRCYEHVWALRGEKHKNYLLQNAWKKYGEGSFTFEVLEKVGTEDLLRREQHWIDTFQAAGEGYNLNPTAGSNLGKTFGEAARKNMSAAGSRVMADPEMKARHQEGVRRAMADPEVRRKMSEAAKRRQADPEKRAAFMEATNSPEARAKKIETLRKVMSNRPKKIKEPVTPADKSKIDRRSDPELRKNHSEKMKLRMQDPALRFALSKREKADPELWKKKGESHSLSFKIKQPGVYIVLTPSGQVYNLGKIADFCQEVGLTLAYVRRKLKNGYRADRDVAIKGFTFKKNPNYAA